MLFVAGMTGGYFLQQIHSILTVRAYLNNLDFGIRSKSDIKEEPIPLWIWIYNIFI